MNVVTGVEMHQIDRYAIEEIGLQEALLMENAGHAFVNKIQPLLKKDARIAVLIGVGNNGGDGFVISRLLLDKGYDVDVWLIPPVTKVSGTARMHMDVFLKSGYGFLSYDCENSAQFFEALMNYSDIVDAMLGTGLKGELRAPYKEIILQMNELPFTVYSVDLPSGLSADGDQKITTAVKADVTVTFQCPKLGAYVYPDKEYYGKLHIVDIGIPKLAIDANSNNRYLWLEDNVKATIPVRKPAVHKGNNGKGLIIAGSATMTGAAILTTKACHRLGAGLVTLAVPDTIYNVVTSHLIEATFHICSSKKGEISDLNISGDTLNESYDAIAIGPGLGRQQQTEIVEMILSKFQAPVIIDADGLFHLKRSLHCLKERKGISILTPHLGEFAYLCDLSIDEIEKNRFQIARDFAEKYRVYLLLKGPHTIVTTPNGEQFMNTTGNSALAKGGSGDVLTGMILALIMQQENVQAAINNAAFLHGLAADQLVQGGYSPLSVIASDIVEAMPVVLSSFHTS